jgi:hypothetical protein
LLIGLMQMTGDLLNLPALKGIGAATAISPAPKVFTAIRGYEAYSTNFYLEWTDHNGAAHSQQLTPERYARVAGPYNRRNIYGAVLAGGPVLATDERLRPLFDSVSRYVLSGDAALLRELGLDPASIDGTIRVRYEPLPGTQMNDLPRVLEIKSQQNSTGSGSDRVNP